MSGQDPRYPNELNIESNKRDPLEARRLTNNAGAQLKLMMPWMLILITCICIIRRLSPNGISTLNVLAMDKLKQDISLKGTETNKLGLNSIELN